MPMIPTDSSAVKAYWYDQNKEQLKIRYPSGDVYTYLDVPPKVVKRMESATSMGRFLNKNIKPSFAYRKG